MHLEITRDQKMFLISGLTSRIRQYEIQKHAAELEHDESETRVLSQFLKECNALMNKMNNEDEIHNHSQAMNYFSHPKKQFPVALTISVVMIGFAALMYYYKFK